jgi:NADH dehydrogenase [ubiquinone] 1 alpha subcomplex assembly factor 7
VGDGVEISPLALATSTTSTTATTSAPAPKVGDGVEISPLALATCEDVAQRVVACGGAALLVDYGEDFTQEDTLRAYLKHKQVSVLSQVHRRAPCMVVVCVRGFVRLRCIPR